MIHSSKLLKFLVTIITGIIINEIFYFRQKNNNYSMIQDLKNMHAYNYNWSS